MREIEIKARVTNPQKTLQLLDSLGVKLSAAKKQRDVVYGEPGITGPTPGAKWLRIRTENDKKVIFTLKQPMTGELDSLEHEVEVSDAGEMEKIITALGYKHFSEVTKHRRKAKIGDIEVCFDEVEELGIFIELEKLCDETADPQKVAAELWQKLETFGITKEDEVTSGYDILLHQLQHPKEKTDTVAVYYTDGSCSPNPGPGGFAVILDGQPVVLGKEDDSTNIRMEGKALIAALKHANGRQCEIFTDSEFWINVITKWSIAWEKNGWKKSGGEIKNLDIVQEVCPLYRSSQAKLTWVRGHNNDEGNELADHWANEARKK